ncbi:hypothetical protein GA0115240_15428 [Streptomyces sp. DvalAA-14]|uniref:hypothetical protein n=1 Tax=unclassified Streptomyces TaxID=2593676 RepID=UPI00081B7F08|nr:MULTISPECIES: hypothetical protein [unclassified Streptomyces]MYS23604.1 hypothetical protein [Streptomyces sp. SID4948]SCE36057.1 hypothetical protein GA0115240_15428 [Streptomyces sp. DvalAA-14]
MSDHPPAGGCACCWNAGGSNRQQGTRGLSVQGRTGDVHYYAAACEHHSAASARRSMAGFSPVPYETLREELHRIIRACSLIVDDLRDDTDDSGGSPWD